MPLTRSAATCGVKLADIKRIGGATWRAYAMKESFRAIFAGDLTREEAAEALDLWCARAQRCRLDPFVKAARTMRARRELILNAVEHGISNGRVEGLNTKVRLMMRRGYGFHSPEADRCRPAGYPARDATDQHLHHDG